MPVSVGVTASRHGLKTAQLKELTTWLTVLRKASTSSLTLKDTFHHGDCVGGDEQAAEIAKELGYWIVGHPPTKDKWRAWFPSDETREPRGYHDRNMDIVSESGVLFGAPASMTDRSGGTWWTINWATEVGSMYLAAVRRPIVVIRPDGSIWLADMVEGL